jgi:signal transduction histidine kinase/CheY-like chemotaxis protein
MLTGLLEEVWDRGYMRFTWQYQSAIGTLIPVEKVMVVISDRSGEKVLASFTLDRRPMAERDKLVRESELMRDELGHAVASARQANEAKSQFLASMSHEIRTPMNAILGMTDLMRTDNLDDTQAGYFEDIRKMSKSLLQIINDILDFSKLEAGRMDIKPVHFNLLEFFDSICSLAHFQAECKDLVFYQDFSPSVPHVVIGDEVRIRQVLTNFLNNAVKFTTSGKVGFTVDMEIEDAQEYVAFSISDTGPGLKEEDQQRLFTPFTRLGNVQMSPGTGLGLSIAKNLVDLMRGMVRVKSTWHKGTTFTILLPLPEGDVKQIARPELQHKAVAVDNAAVLVVDDNKVNLKVAQAYLSRHNIKPDLALSGYEALEKTGKRHYDLVLLDHMMPGMDGLETAAKIRALPNEYARELPIVAFTANAVSGMREMFLEAGMNDFMSKPIMPADLNRVLFRWLPHDKLKQESFLEGAPHHSTDAGDAQSGAARGGAGGGDEEEGTLADMLGIKEFPDFTPSEDEEKLSLPPLRAKALAFIDSIRPLVSNGSTALLEHTDEIHAELSQFSNKVGVFLMHIDNYDFDLALDILKEIRGCVTQGAQINVTGGEAKSHDI